MSPPGITELCRAVGPRWHPAAGCDVEVFLNHSQGACAVVEPDFRRNGKTIDALIYGKLHLP